MIAFGPSEEQEMIRDTVREFAAGEMREIARAADEAGAVPEGFLERIWELGLVNSAIPERLGGGGLDRSPVTNALVLEELAYGDPGLAVAAIAPATFVHALLDFGTEEQQAEHLKPFAQSTPRAAGIAVHEQTFAFDLANLRTVAEPKGSGFRIRGTKRLVPFAETASHLLVVARAGAREGLEDLEAFVVPRDASGVNVAAETTMGLRAAPFARVDLDGVEVPAEARLGGERGVDGRRLAASLRAGTAALSVGLSRAVLDLAVPYAKDRVAFGQPIAQKQAIAFKLAEMQIEVNAMRWLVWQAASRLEAGTDATREAQMAQTYAARRTMRIADDGVQVFGGHGYIREYPVEMWYRDARTATVLETVAAL